MDDADILDRAITLHQAGQTAEAEQLYNEILADDPDQPDALNLLGLILQNRGALDAAISLLSKALAVDPDFPEALTNRARAQLAAGQSALAAADAARALELDAGIADAALILCRARTNSGDLTGAAEAGRRAVVLAPGSHDAHFYLGIALEQQLEWRQAAGEYRLALAARPHYPPLKAKLALALSESGEHQEAITLAKEVVAAAPNDAPPLFLLGRVLHHGKEIAESVALMERCLAMMPEHADAWSLQGQNHSALGHFDDAEACFRKSIALDPTKSESWRSLAKMGRLAGAEAEAVLRATLHDEKLPLWDRAVSGFALGAVHDKAGAYDEAFQAYSLGNRLARALNTQRGEVNNPAAFRKDIDNLIAAFTPGVFAAGRPKGNQSEQPVFVVGMPRSGTTLVEQIAASHARVKGVGETADMEALIRRVEARQPGLHATQWNPAVIREETEGHLAALRKRVGEADRVVDKLPDNVALVGLITMLFPRARVILCYRDVRDIGLSCYFQHFLATMPWSFDLNDCGVRMREIYRLMDHWQRVEPLRMLKVVYEDLVADLEGQSRRIIDFLGLDWGPNCLNFHKTEREVFTASQWQVRQPLYASSVGRWRHYRQHIQPLLDGLQEYAPAGE